MHSGWLRRLKIASLAVVPTLLFNISGFTGEKVGALQPSVPSSSLQSSTSEKTQKDISLAWFTSSTLKNTDIVSSSDAKSFINDVYQTLDENIFNPSFKKELREQHLRELIAQAGAKSNWSRSELTALINNQLKKLRTSHVRLLDPVEGAKLFRLLEQNSSSSIKAGSAVSAQVSGKVGILRVKSFIVPQITKRAVDQAKAQLSQAKIILIDLRENGGGAESSISYLIEDIIGADKVISVGRSRDGLTMKKPYIFQGYFDDSVKNVGIAETKLAQEKKYVEYRTRSEAKKDPRLHFVLVDDKCGSACEVFAAATQQHKSAKILGFRTMGAVFGAGAYKLRWQGYALIAPASKVVSPKGSNIEGTGVQPDIEISECKANGTQCLEKAIEIVAANAV